MEASKDSQATTNVPLVEITTYNSVVNDKDLSLLQSSETKEENFPPLVRPALTTDATINNTSSAATFPSSNETVNM